MRMNWGKSFKLLFVLMLAAGMIAACSNGGSNEETSPSASAPASSASAEPTSTGETTAGITFPYTGDPQKFTGFWMDFGLKPDTQIRQEYLKKIGNISYDWELTTEADYDQKLNLMLSSNEIPDIVVARNALNVSDTFGSAGVLLDFEKYKDYMPNFQNLVAKYPFLDQTLTKDGKRYVLPSVAVEDQVQEGWFYNQTLLDKYDIPVPETQEELVAAMKKIKELDPEVVPYLNHWNLSYVIDAMSNMYSSMDDGLAFDQATGKWYFGPFKEDGNYKPLLQFVKSLWDDGLLHPEVLTQSDEQVWAALAEGNWAFTYTYHDVWYSQFKAKGINLDFDVEPMATPKLNGKAYLNVTVPFDSPPYWGIVSSADAKNPELLAALLDYSYSDEVSDLVNWGIEGVTYQVNADGKKEVLPEVKTPSHPDGTLKLEDIGFGRSYDVQSWFGSLEAGRAFGYDDFAMKSAKFQEDAIASGRVTPIYGSQPRPQLSEEEANRVSEIITPIKTFIDESETKFILGDESFDDWDKFIADIRKMGNVDEIVDLLNSKEQYARAERGASGLAAK